MLLLLPERGGEPLAGLASPIVSGFALPGRHLYTQAHSQHEVKRSIAMAAQCRGASEHSMVHGYGYASRRTLLASITGVHTCGCRCQERTLWLSCLQSHSRAQALWRRCLSSLWEASGAPLQPPQHSSPGQASSAATDGRSPLEQCRFPSQARHKQEHIVEDHRNNALTAQASQRWSLL